MKAKRFNKLAQFIKAKPSTQLFAERQSPQAPNIPSTPPLLDAAQVVNERTNAMINKGKELDENE